MPRRIFTAFAMVDKTHRDLFVGQAKNNRVSYEFTDMSVKQPWDSSWKTQCRTRIRSCSGFIALITQGLATAKGALWEIECAKSEGIPILGVYMGGTNSLHSPVELYGYKKVNWRWDEISNFIENS